MNELIKAPKGYEFKTVDKNSVELVKIEELRVPDTIKFINKECLLFNDGKQALCYFAEGLYSVLSNEGCYISSKQPLLRPIDKKDIKAGMIIYCTNNDNNIFSELVDYELALSDCLKKSAYVFQGGINQSGQENYSFLL